jgi:tetratricopeptide (TPR) repeat protein
VTVTFWRNTASTYLKYLALTVVVFAPALTGQILYWDDTTHIQLNPDLQSGNWTFFWFYPYYRLYIPVFYTVWTWLYAINPEPWIFHAFNLCAHALCGLLVYHFLKKAVPKASGTALTLASIAFLIHPLQNETAAWISGGRDLLSAVFGLTAVLCLWQTSIWFYGGATIFFILGLLSKATLAPLPVAILMIPNFRAILNRSRMAVLAVWLVAAIVVLGVNKSVQQEDADHMVAPVSLFARPLIAADSLGFYAQKLAVPFPIASDYGRTPEFVLEKFHFAPSILVLILTIGFLYWLRRREVPLYGIGFFILILGPVLGLVPFMAQAQSTVADRYVYLGMAGLAMTLAHVLSGPIRRTYIFSAILLIWAGIGFVRSQDYKDNDTFFTSMLDYNPDSFVGHTTIGVVYFGDGRMDRSEHHFRQAMRLRPRSISPLGNLAQLLWNQQRFPELLATIEPLYLQSGMIEANENNLGSMARCARLLARAYVVLGRGPEANNRYCESLKYNSADTDTMSEYAQYLNEMRAKGIAITPCAFPPPP